MIIIIHDFNYSIIILLWYNSNDLIKIFRYVIIKYIKKTKQNKKLLYNHDVSVLEVHEYKKKKFMKYKWISMSLNS